MRKYLPYIIAVIVVFLLGGLIVTNSKRARELDERITLRYKDKIPYGTSAAINLLPSLFPNASFFYSKTKPVYWDSINTEESNQAVVLVADLFNADEDELSRLFSFVKNGNYVFIIAKSFSYDAIESFHFSYNENSVDNFMNLAEDSLRVRLEKPFFATEKTFIYPGRKYESYFYSIDTSHTKVLGRTEEGRPNFVQMNTGSGSLFIHVAPLAFSNYFVLHKNNVEYLENAFSVIPGGIHKLLWNEYYLIKPAGNKGEPNWLGVLMRYPSFKWGLLTGMVTLLLFVFFSMRRQQRMIPAFQQPKNESLDFVKTLGRLYYEKKDHTNLARKMGIYFLDHVRSRYKLSTLEPDEIFIRHLHYKSGYSLEGIKSITDYIIYVNTGSPVAEEGLATFHTQLEKFYQNT